MHRTNGQTVTHRGSKKSPALLAGVALGAVVAASGPVAAQAPADLDRLLAVIETQQQQIDALRAEVDAMKSAQARSAPAVAATPAPVAVAQAPAVDPAGEEFRPEAQMVEEGFTWRDRSGRSHLSGQLNPAFNVVDDGVSTDVFIVDNDTSSSRFRLDADAPLGETSVRAAIEVGVSPNNSNSVSQLTPNVDASFDVKAEVAFRNDTYGRLQVGKGSSAADDTAEYDLSLVAGPIMYAGVADIAGESSSSPTARTSSISGRPRKPDFLAVNAAFFDFDPGNLNRVRYDSPMFGPAQGSVSFGADDQWAAAVTSAATMANGAAGKVGNFTRARRRLHLQSGRGRRRLRLCRLRLDPARPDRTSA